MEVFIAGSGAAVVERMDASWFYYSLSNSAFVACGWLVSLHTLLSAVHQNVVIQ
jgi:hypothetical protein